MTFTAYSSENHVSAIASEENTAQLSQHLPIPNDEPNKNREKMPTKKLPPKNVAASKNRFKKQYVSVFLKKENLFT